MFVLVTCQSSNPELFGYKFALNHCALPNQGLCDFKIILNLTQSTLTAGDNHEKSDQLTN